MRVGFVARSGKVHMCGNVIKGERQTRGGGFVQRPFGRLKRHMILYFTAIQACERIGKTDGIAFYDEVEIEVSLAQHQVAHNPANEKERQTPFIRLSSDSVDQFGDFSSEDVLDVADLKLGQSSSLPALDMAQTCIGLMAE